MYGTEDLDKTNMGVETRIGNQESRYGGRRDGVCGKEKMHVGANLRCERVSE